MSLLVLPLSPVPKASLGDSGPQVLVAVGAIVRVRLSSMSARVTAGVTVTWYGPDVSTVVNYATLNPSL